ncbi:MAG: sulfate ABC transporter substrate-binding protein [Synechococcaceae cyanobacterium SM2_3_1]|nr:sulfate ABC transporter substrate-binding protein [Synechococcaceae cyanobacterium SM2_3_1]
MKLSFPKLHAEFTKGGYFLLILFLGILCSIGRIELSSGLSLYFSKSKSLGDLPVRFSLSSLFTRSHKNRFSLILFFLGTLLTLGIAHQPLLPPAQAQEVELTLVSFAVTRAAYDRIIPNFVDYWQKEKGQKVTFQQSYGGSGSQTRAVIDGLPADIVHLALALDTDRLVQENLVKPDYQQRIPNDATVTRSVATIWTREGNPKGINDWTDLAKDGVQLITANPKTSGVARWNFLALWGAVTETGGTEAEAIDFVTHAYNNVPILTRDAREATDIFLEKGQGDALINYENEALLAQLEGKTVNFTVPQVNISIDNPIAVVDANVDQRGTREVAEAFVNYLFTPEAQRIFASVGFRPVDPQEAKRYEEKFPPVKTLFTVDSLGGWQEVQEKFFADGALFDQIQSSR